MSQKALIIGCGYVGSALAIRLAHEGFKVSAIRRTWEQKIAHIDCIEQDIFQDFELKDSFDLVVYCIAAGERSKTAYQRAYSIGIQHTLSELCKNQGIKPFVVFTSSTSVYKERLGNVVTEKSELEDISTYSRSLISGEEQVRNYSERHLVLRLSGIYGPKRNHLLKNLKTNYPYFSNNPYSNRVHLQDIVGAILYLYLNKETGTFNISDSQPTKIHDIFHYIEKKLQTEIRYDKNKRESPTGKKVSNQKLLDTGYKMELPTFKEGFAEALKNYKG